MQRGISDIDRLVGKQVGRLPKVFYQPFVWLGRFTTPALWASYLLLFQLVAPSLSTPPLLGWVIIILLPLASVIKLFFRRTRPPTIYTESMRIKSYSFPSSHAYSAALSTGYLSVVSLHAGEWWGLAWLIGAALVGVSRIYVGAHYPSDVAAGWALGALCVIGAAAVL